MTACTSYLGIIALCKVFEPLVAVCVNRPLGSYSNKFYPTTLTDANLITSMRVLKNYSDAPCTYDWSFGYYGVKVWVHRKCRAKFQICYTRGPSVTVTCKSDNFRYTECTTGMPCALYVYVSTVLSIDPCIMNFSYGVKEDRVWVDKGCKATFRVTG